MNLKSKEKNAEDKEGIFIMIKDSIDQEDITMWNLYVPM